LSTHFVSAETGNASTSLEELYNEFLMIQSGEKRIAIIGTRNLSMPHQQIIEVLSYSLAQVRNTIITSGGASGVNMAVIKGVLRADPKLLEVVLPQTKKEQSAEFNQLLPSIHSLTEHSDRLDMSSAQANRICYNEIIDTAHQIIIFLYHDSNTLSEAITYAKLKRKICTVFYLD